jgi:putative tricarboxylic transport membrane protein
MSDQPQGKGPPHRAVEVLVALATIAFAALIIIGSLEAGIDWGAEGPRAGFFPFYLGLVILAASVVNLAQAFTASGSRGGPFASWRQLGQVLSVALPTAIYVAVIPYIGIYVASALLIALFMVWLGRYGVRYVAPIALGVPLVTFLIFERWFVVALPKGPLESALGF